MSRCSRTCRAAALAAAALLAGCLASTRAEDPMQGPVQRSAVFALHGEGADSAEPTFGVRAVAIVDARPDLVFEWAATENGMAAWLAEEVRLDPAEGGEIAIAWPAAGVHTRGTVVKHDSFERSVELDLAAYAGAPATHVRLTVKPATGWTEVAVEQWPFEASPAGESAANLHRDYWTRALRVLRAAIERRLPTVPAVPPTVPAAPPGS